MASKVTKASAQAEIVTGQAALELNKATTAVSAAVKAVEGLTGTLSETLETLGLKVAAAEVELEDLKSHKTEAIAQLDKTYSEKERTLAVDLDLKVKANAEAVVNKELSNQGKTAIYSSELKAIKDELTTLKNDFNRNVTVETEKVRKELASAYGMEKQLLESQYQAKEAQNTATISNLSNQNQFLADQVDMWKKQLEAERAASISRATGQSQPVINVSSAK